MTTLGESTTTLPTRQRQVRPRERNTLLALAERGVLPDGLIRLGIKRLLRKRLAQERAGGVEAIRQRAEQLIETLSTGPVAVETDAANDQHYELPPQFMQLALGDRLKYSCCHWPEGTATLDQAELAALKLVGQRAALTDGQDVLELGCGWGSLTLWMAEQYPGSRITAVSNSAPQRRFIEQRAAERGLTNVNIITCDMNDFAPSGQFDRVVSIEMFEHMHNLAELFRRVGGWLRAGGKLFVHVFCHHYLAYLFETEGDANWLGRHFFTGGVMPSADLLPRLCGPLTHEAQWDVCGTHYQKTAEAWLDNVDERRREVRAIMADTYGEADADLWLQRWRMFFMACAELWGFRGGNEWHVAHYRFARPSEQGDQ